jgi:pyruvate dehydrogenase E1 component beta subunit
MAEITYREALRQAMDEEMARDENVILLGEEVAEYNGAYKVSMGLLDKYGPERIKDTPITEGGFTGVGIGAAMNGLRPIVEWMTYNFSIQALDQVINNAAKYLYMSGGQINVPIVFRGPNGPAEYLSSQHSQALQTFFVHCPGMKVVAPSTPYDAKGLLKSAIRDNNPVAVLEGEMMYGWKGEVPEKEYLVPIGKAEIKQSGEDLTIITYSKSLEIVLKAVDQLNDEGVKTEVIDLRTLRPLDEETIFTSVKKTNRCVIVEDSWPVCSLGSYISHLITMNCFTSLDAAVEVINFKDVPMPYNHKLELAVQPSLKEIISAVNRVLYRGESNG